jgi:hypothetical protein
MRVEWPGFGGVKERTVDRFGLGGDCSSPEPFDFLAAFLAPEADDDAPVGDSVGQSAEAPEGFGAKDDELLELPISCPFG